MELSNESFDQMATQLSMLADKYHDYELPQVSIVIPAFNCAQNISATLDSVLKQNYPNFELVVVESGSIDRTLEIIESYQDSRIHIYSVPIGQRYEMINKGISQSRGAYINFLFPGDFYIHQNTLKYMMSLALENPEARLVYCGTLLREGRTEVKVLFRSLSIDLLRRGQQPTSLQSIWFRQDVFKEIGKFNTSLQLRGGYELLCRFCLHENLKTASTSRVLIDYDLRWVTKWMVIRHFFETMQIVHQYFGFWATVRWLFIQKDTLRFTKLWWRSVKVAFYGR